MANLGNIFDTPDRTGEFDSTDIQSTSAICGISYFPPLFFLPLVTSSNSEFGKFHANQALLALIYCAAAGIVGGVLGFMFGILTEIPIMGWLFALVGGLLGFAIGISAFVMVVIGMINGFTGKAKELPIIGKFTIIK